ncbi:conserved hypothetical protein [Verticillium alfalfae VaMs.102]|uniref:FAD dependent oxidoreductase domain-containing protein n=1 Tax=Verticillium alfalfae (strain VaMs.102 / ATCC MYA-4576 / FGSC 10136) TaxID=526221 RepID=C9ST90_VERA1|nr:conserved hypothetical protein [Verticillium alfalfae VaMs.102]EEY22005.1 conserved hypothetical protein [Verticillium alfalfae VaMs.102]
MSTSSPPSSILIIGSGVFGLSTALALALRPAYAKTEITVLDRSPEQGVFPSHDASSIDSSRIIRPDYADPAYSALAAAAHHHWRHSPLGEDGRYTESGMALIADAPPAHVKTRTQMDYVRDSYANVKRLAQRKECGIDAARLSELPSRRAIAELVGLNPADANADTDADTTPGDWGYLNGNSGWADARPQHAIKVARQGYELRQPAPTPAAALATRPERRLAPTTSLPYTPSTNPALRIPAEAEADLRRVLRATVPLAQLHDRPFAASRICWYTDTPTGDFLVDYHPGWRGLFLATAGSGHGFKFLPIIGDHIVDCVEGRRPEAFDDKWRWRGVERRDDDVEQVYEHIVTEDGSRGGKLGLVLAEELAKSHRAKM